MLGFHAKSCDRLVGAAAVPPNPVSSTLEPMSFQFYLYRAAEGLPPISKWNEMLAHPLGSMDVVKDQLAILYPQVTWKKSGGWWYGIGPDRGAEPYLDILLTEQEPGQCYFVVLNKAPPSAMRKIIEALNLNYVAAPESGDLVDPYAYDDDNRYYAKRDWQSGL